MYLAMSSSYLPQYHRREKQCFLKKPYHLFLFASLFRELKILFFPICFSIWFFDFFFLFRYVLTLFYFKFTVTLFFVNNFFTFLLLFLPKVFSFPVKIFLFFFCWYLCLIFSACSFNSVFSFTTTL